PADLLGDGDAGADGAPELPALPTHPDDMAFWLYSSGSTGRPKGVVHRQADPAAICQTYGASVLQLSDADVTYSTTKLYHAYGIGNGLFFPYWAGATTVLTPGRPSPDAIFATAEARRPGSSGRPVPGYELLVRGDDGRPVATGEVGELLVKGDSALSGYWHHRDRSRRTLVGEYFATGDRYRCDEDGFYWYEGRA